MRAEKREIMLKHQLDQYYESLRQDTVSTINTRKWCLTLWIAILGLIGSKEIVLEQSQTILFISSPIFIFWVLEAFQKSFSYRNTLKVKELEMKIYNDEPIDLDDFYINFRLSIPLKIKILDLVKTSFTSEVLLFFYLLLAIFSIIFYITIS